jgi:hypothetical protein
MQQVNFSIMLMITMFSQMKSSSKPTFFYEFFDGDTGKALVRPIKPDGPLLLLI